MILLSCSHCHNFNRAGERWCSACGHRVGVPRALCDCQQCRRRPAFSKGAQHDD
jgi:hypothetical protein